jgi:N utilization substance protein B
MTNGKEQATRHARFSAARLAAVQAVYQMMANSQRADSVIKEFRMRRLGRPVEDEAMVSPDQTLFCTIVEGVENRRPDLDTLLAGPEGKGVREPLLQSVLLCGAWELMARHDLDAPVIIDDYLHVTHAFFDQGESRLVNGILDRVSKAVRDNHEA